jgi:hypothetical protein
VPLIERKRKLLRLLARTTTCIQFVDHFPNDGESVFRHACMMGLEGVVSKRTRAVDERGVGASAVHYDRFRKHRQGDGCFLAEMETPGGY